MKIRDAFFLSLKKFRFRPKSNFYLISSISIIFCLIFLMDFLCVRFKTLYLDYSSQGTNGKVILNVFSDEGSSSQNEITSDVEKFSGEVLGKAKYYDNYIGIILPEDLVKSLISDDYATFPKTKAPILISTFTGEKFLDTNFAGGIENFDAYKNSLLGKSFTSDSGVNLFVVGLAPGNFHSQNFSLKNVNKNNGSVINAILELLSTSSGHTIVIDNGNLDPEKITEYDQLVVVFDNYSDASAFLENGHGNSEHTAFSNRTYHISYLAGPDPDVLYLINIHCSIKNIICGILFAIATIIIIFSFIRILDRDKKSRTLYRSLGATPNNIRRLYIFYFSEIIFVSIILALALASTATFAISASNRELFEKLFTVALSLM